MFLLRNYHHAHHGLSVRGCTELFKGTSRPSSLLDEGLGILHSRECRLPLVNLPDLFHLCGLAIFDRGHVALEVIQVLFNLDDDGWDDGDCLRKLRFKPGYSARVLLVGWQFSLCLLSLFNTALEHVLFSFVRHMVLFGTHEASCFDFQLSSCCSVHFLSIIFFLKFLIISLIYDLEQKLPFK